MKTETTNDKYCNLDMGPFRLVAFSAPGKPTKYIGKQVCQTPDQTRIFEIACERSDGFSNCRATCTENGRTIFELETPLRFNLLQRMAVKCLKKLVQTRIAENLRRRRRRKAIRAVKSVAEQPTKG